MKPPLSPSPEQADVVTADDSGNDDLAPDTLNSILKQEGLTTPRQE
jgi:predicted RNA binding protein YcfA (HicA-like mRNA interferase family)